MVKKFVRQTILDEKAKRTRLKRVDDRIAKESLVKYSISQIASTFKHIKDESLKSKISIQDLLASYGLNGPLYYYRNDLLKIENELRAEHDEVAKRWRIEDAKKRHETCEKMQEFINSKRGDPYIKPGKGVLSINGARSIDILMKYGFMGTILMRDRSYANCLKATSRLTIWLKDRGVKNWKSERCTFYDAKGDKFNPITLFDWREAQRCIEKEFPKQFEDEDQIAHDLKVDIRYEGKRRERIRAVKDKRNETRRRKNEFKNRLGL